MKKLIILTCTLFYSVIFLAQDCDTLDTQWYTPMPTSSNYGFGGGYISGVPDPINSVLPTDPKGIYEGFFTPNPGTTPVNSVKVGLGYLMDIDNDVTFSVNVYDDNGAGEPGAFVGGVSGISPTVLGVPGFGQFDEFLIPLPTYPVPTTGFFHVGVIILSGGDGTDTLVVETSCLGPADCAVAQGEADASNHISSSGYGYENFLVDYGADFDIHIIPGLGFPITETDTRTECGSLVWIDGNTYNSNNNTATFNIVNGAASGCDSLVTLNLTIVPALTGTDNTTICATGSVDINGTTYNAATPNGTEVFTNVGPYNCDSTVTVALNVLPAIVGSQTLVECQGFTVTVGTNTYNATGVYTDVLTSATLCDSIVTTDLTINQPTVGSQTLVECQGFSVTVGTNTYNATGVYTDVLTNALGCDSTVTTDLTINQPTIGSQTLVECQGFSVTVGTNTYNATGVYTDVLTNALGCDSTVTTDLTINQPTVGSQTLVECQGFTVTVGTNTYNTTGVYTDVLTNALGCDSTVTTDLTINQPTIGSQTLVECQGFTVTVGTNTYNATGVYTDVLTNALGCDSTVTTDLTINQPTIGSQTLVECQGFTVTVGTNTYNTTGVYTDVLTNALGCDSTVTTDLTINQPTIGSQTLVECQGFTVTVGTNTYNATGVYTDVLTNALGCDSTVTTDLTIEAAIDATVDNTLAPTLTANQTGASYQWVDCDNANAPIPLATNASYTATVNGNYAVEVTVGLCMVTSGCENITGVGVKEAISNVVSIYPNPTKGMFTISLTNANQAISYTVTTLEGRIVEQANNITQANIDVDLTNESKGVYFLIIQENNTNTTYKIIRQ